MQRIIRIQKANSMKTCTCYLDKQLSLLRFWPHLAYFFNKYKAELPDNPKPHMSMWKGITHHVCNIEIDFNDSDQRLKYFHTIKARC